MTWWVNISKNACLHFPFTKLTVLKMVVTVKHVHAYPKTNMHTLKQIWYYLHHYKKYQQTSTWTSPQTMHAAFGGCHLQKKHSCFAIFRNAWNNNYRNSLEKKYAIMPKVTGPQIHSLFIHSNMQQPQVIIKHRVGIYYFKYCVTYLGNHSCHASVTRMTTLMQHHLQWHLTHKHKDLGMAWTQLVLIWAHG